MVINQYCYRLAELANQTANSIGIINLQTDWLYAQFMHESDGMTSKLAIENHNLGGLTQETPNGDENKQPDGAYWYKKFDSYESYSVYFGAYLKGFMDGSGVQNATTKNEYLTALKDSPSGMYFTASLEEYITGTDYWLAQMNV